MYLKRSYCDHTKSVAKSFRISGKVKYYTFITSENVTGKHINNIKWQCLLYVLNNNSFFQNLLELFHYEGSWAWRLVIQWLSVLFLAFVYRFIQKNERKRKELKITLDLVKLNSTPFSLFLQYRNFHIQIFICQFVLHKL